MRAISLWQPWASLMAEGVKTIETRGWSTKYRGPLLVCSAKRMPTAFQSADLTVTEPMIREGYWRVSVPTLRNEFNVQRQIGLPLGAALCVVDLVDVLPMRDGGSGRGPDVAARIILASERGWICRPSADEGSLTRIDNELPYGDFTPGRFGWITTNLRKLDPIPVKGKQGLWTPDAELIAAVESQIGVNA